MFGRLQKCKTVKYCAAFVEYLSCFAAKHGTEKLRDIANRIQVTLAKYCLILTVSEFQSFKAF